jgi:uncharacterized membrane protein YeaQ/YmgE (transglycosylase-associated protein family)
MQIEPLILSLIIGAVAGWLAGNLMRGGGFGVVGNIVVGIIGGLVGGFLFAKMGISGGSGWLGSLAVSTIGAAVLLFVVGLIKRA